MQVSELSKPMATKVVGENKVPPAAAEEPPPPYEAFVKPAPAAGPSVAVHAASAPQPSNPSRPLRGGVRIQELAPEYFNGARKVFNNFIGHAGRGKKACGCCCYSWCPSSENDFKKMYLKHSDMLNFTAVAVRVADNQVVGIIKLYMHGQPRNFGDSMMHETKPGEAYIEWAAVEASSRGQGLGTRLLQWCEDKARAQGAYFMSLGVVSRNPAARLYERFGFKKVPSGCCGACCGNLMICCCIGCPNSGCGGYEMHKLMRQQQPPPQQVME